MNRTETIRKVAAQCGLSKKTVSDVIDAFQTVATEALVGSDEINLTGFGKLKIVERKERNGIHPGTLKPMTIKASKVVKFTMGNVLRAALR